MFRYLLASLGWLALLLPFAPKSMYQKAFEVCENARDDDGDGLIDLNDPDCACPEAKPVSLIPNPSFEAMNCCPSSRSQLNCAETWIQASEATTDYLHTCGWMGWDHMPPPLPFPDGIACVGYRNGRFNNVVQPGWKEYTGACLTSPLRVGVSYRFEFYIGFTHAQYSPPTQVVFFGSNNCKNLPFGVGNANYGCPTNGVGWKQMGQVQVSGTQEWKKVSLTVTPTEDVYAIAIGPDCNNLSASGDIYYFFDNLVLADQRAFEFEITAVEHPCSNTFTLQVPSYDTLQYQWYKEGVALVGETKAKLQIKTGDGNYTVRILSPSSCRITQVYSHRIPFFIAEVSKVICKDESYNFHNQIITKSGNYEVVLKTAQNCDSTVLLGLRVADEAFDTISGKIFKGEFYKVGNYQYDRPGIYNVTLQSVYGCDSLVQLHLQLYNIFFPSAFSPNADGSNDRFTVFGGDDLVLVKNLQIFNRWGDLVFQKTDFAPNDGSTGWDGNANGKAAANGVYVYTTRLLLDDGKTRDFAGSILLLR